MKREYYKELWSFRWNGQTSQKTQLTKTDLGFRLKKKKANILPRWCFLCLSSLVEEAHNVSLFHF